MDHQNDFYQQIHDMDKQRSRAKRKEKWEKREKIFWKAFLFTEDGKPKSGLILYTFCLSFLFLALYLVIFSLVPEYLGKPLERVSPFWGNLIQSLTAGALGLGCAWLAHRLLPDKRLVFGSSLWLAFFALAAGITLLIMLRGTGASGAMLVFFVWFVIIPLAMGLAGSYALYHRDYAPPPPPGEPWKKYTNRR